MFWSDLGRLVKDIGVSLSSVIVLFGVLDIGLGHDICLFECFGDMSASINDSMVVSSSSSLVTVLDELLSSFLLCRLAAPDLFTEDGVAALISLVIDLAGVDRPESWVVRVLLESSLSREESDFDLNMASDCLMSC